MKSRGSSAAAFAVEALMEKISSRKNPLLVHMKRLGADKAYRRASGEFICEGEKLLGEALTSGAEITAVLSSRPLPGLPDGLRQAELPADVLASISTQKSPDGVLFSCRLPAARPFPEGGRLVLLENIQDPGNFGTVLRCAGAFGFDGLLAVGACADPWGPKTVRASMGASFRVPVWETDIETLAASGLRLCAAALGADSVDIRRLDLQGLCPVIGSEGRGISPELLKICEKKVKIPMPGGSESLNAAVAAAIILWEMTR